MKGNYIARFFITRDIFGHPMQMVFKGRESYNSIIGGIVTIIMQLLTSIIIIQALVEVLFMNDPKILSYPLPLSREDRIGLVPVLFHEFNYVYAVKVHINAKEDVIPEEVGRFGVINFIIGGENETLDLHNCTSVLDDKMQDEFINSFCIKPEESSVGHFEDKIESNGQLIRFDFRECRNLPANPNVTCMDGDELTKWYE